ncbi:heavy-metal-associated domain-containing protein [Azospira inquinata]
MMETTTLKVGGMSCQKCVASLTSVLSKLPGVAQAEVVLEPGQATVTYDPAQVGTEQLRQAVEDAGFDAL